MDIFYTDKDGTNTREYWSERGVRFRHPVKADGAAVWSLVKRCGGLDLNSPYAYLMACQNWSETCVLAADDSGPVGVVVAYRLTARPGVLFIWQVGVAPEHWGQGLGRAMLLWLIDRTAPSWLEATVTPGNAASRALFSGLARDLKVGVVTSPWLSAADFPDAHEGEDLFRIGPFPNHEAQTTRKECDHEDL